MPLPAIESDGDSAEGPFDWEAVHRHGEEEADHDEPPGAAVWQHLDVAAGPMRKLCPPASRNPACAPWSAFDQREEGGQDTGARPCAITMYGRRTNISSAVSDGLFSRDMVSEADRRLERLDLLAIAGSRNGLRETGRGGGSSKGEAGLCAVVGDTAPRLRKGLFEERFKSNPADRWPKWLATQQSVINQAGNRTGPRHHAANDDGERNMKQQSPFHDTTGSNGRANRWTCPGAKAGSMDAKTGKRDATDQARLRGSSPACLRVPPLGDCAAGHASGRSSYE
jgi:hypothetical protein